MKMIRKYTNMAFLLLSVFAIVPVYGNQEVIVDNQEEVVTEPKKAKIVWYKRPEIQKVAIFAVWAAGVCALCYSGFLSVLLNGPKNSRIRGIVVQDNETSFSNNIQNCIVSGEIVQTDGKYTVVTPPSGKPISVKQDSAGIWVKENNSGPWVLLDKYKA